MTSSFEDRVRAHYALEGLMESILAGLEAAGIDRGALRVEDVAPVDEFHTAGRAATLRALERTPFEAGMHLLDAGCGIGGAARVLAAERGCRVTGIDLTPEFVDAARQLTELLHLSGECRFEVGSVLDLPFGGATFDGGLSFHVAMNIADRPRFYAELARVLRPGAPLCIYDVMKGPTEGMLYPVPWAEQESTSFLRSAAETCDLLAAAGFEIAAQESLRDLAIDFFERSSARAAGSDGPPPLGLHLLTGTGSALKFANYVRALNAGQIEPVIVVATRR